VYRIIFISKEVSMKAVNVLILSLALMLSGSAVLAGEATFCISGNSTGVGWSFTVTNWTPPAGGAIGVPGECGGVPEGSGPEVLAEAFVECINTAGEGLITATLVPGQPGCFKISGDFSNVRLDVGPAGSPADCEVTTAGCSFNPTIYLVPASSIPTLTEWGLIIFGLLLAGWMGWMIVRRRNKVTAGI
jgi:hypothetical protein